MVLKFTAKGPKNSKKTACAKFRKKVFKAKQSSVKKSPEQEEEGEETAAVC